LKPPAAPTRSVQRKPTLAPPDLAAIVAELQAAGATSLRAIAAPLNERGTPTATGVGKWRAVQVWRVLARLA